MVALRFERVQALPQTPAANTIYFVKPAGIGYALQYLTGNDGVLIPVGQSAAPTPTPAPLPAFTANPTFQSDGTPQVGERLVGFDGAVTNLGGNTLTRAWLLGTTVYATTSAYTPQQAGTYTFRNRITVAGVNIDASVNVVVAAATPAPTFSRQPSISSDGSSQVGEVAALDLGAANGSLTGRLLRTDNNTVALADATIGSFQWVDAGVYRLEATATNAGGPTTVLSPAITVAAAPAGTLVAPSMSREPGTTVGTNPPALVVSWLKEDGVDRNTDSIQYQYTQTGTYPVTFSEFALASSDGLTYQDSFKVTMPGDLAAGAFKAHARIKRAGVTNPGPWSADFVETLNEATLPPATTTWGTAPNLVVNGPFGSPTYSSDVRTVRLGESKGVASSTAVKGRKAYIEVAVSDVEQDGPGVNAAFGVFDERLLPYRFYNNNPDSGETMHTGWSATTGVVGYNGEQATANPKVGFGAGSVIGVLLEPIPASGTQTGTKVTFYSNGSIYSSFNTNIVEARVELRCLGAHAKFKLNAGQETFTTAGMTAFQWG